MCEKEVPVWKSEEWKRIKSRRERAFGRQIKTEADSVEKVTEPKNLVGLSLSGGGIRSAVYNDGFLQGLSHRGFLRYVDYLCSVSGGGYIAGHLVSQARDPSDEGGKCFHDDADRRDLGRDPITGKVNAHRLGGVGGYLSRTFEFLPAYLWSFFFSFAFYAGMAGIVATLAALFWRSFDDPVFRTLYSGTLGLIKGNELTIAFIPTILLGVLATVSEVGLSGWRLLFGYDRPLPKRIHLVVRKASLVLLSLAILTSIAIFIGNGKTNVSSNAGGQLFLNNYGQFLAISAGIIQILLFLGRDRLFRSERAEAKQWQKHLQRSVTTVVLLFLIFSMVHWMGRENISGYTHNRDPHLVRGDVTNWYVMDQLFASYETVTKQPPAALSPIKSLNPLDEVPVHVKPPSRWIAFLAAGRAGLGFDSWKPGDDLSQPPSPLQEDYASQEEDKSQKKDTLIVWSLPKRIVGAYVAYWLAMSCSDQEDVRQLLETHDKSLSDKSDGATKDNASNNERYATFDDDRPRNSAMSVHEFVSAAFTNVHIANRIQDKRLKRWNKHLQERQFTSFLIGGIEDSSKAKDSTETPDVNVAGTPGSSGNFANLVPKTNSEFIDAQRARIVDVVGRLDLVEQLQGRDKLDSHLLATATRNRLLLETLLPGAVQEQQVASTLVVPPHDQLARRRWLCLWAILTLVGMVGGLGQNHIATVFQFYRQQLGLNFLVATHNPSRQFCDKQLYELHPTDDGLPYPLFLAATLEPTTCNGSYQVEAKPFVFSPLFCGRFDTDDGQIPSKQLSFSSNPASGAVTLGDAITLSGAAVTPLMTGNRWLSIILDFFNTGIGQRLRRLDRTGNEIRRLWTKPIVTSAIVILVTAIVAFYLIRLSPMMVGVFALLTCLACYCIVMRVGSPGLISSLFRPRNRDVKNPTRDDGRSFYVADGGFYDYLGVSELLRRRCELIVVSDTGANIGNDPLGTLAQMCEKASQEMGIRFLDLDHEAPIDFGRLKLTEKRLVHQPYLCMRIRYPESQSREGRSESKPQEGRLFYCQMSITDNDPIEIQHIRNRFPSFPDEPTVNQFYSEEQVSAYRALGYHIANRLCNELQSWRVDDADAATAEHVQSLESEAVPRDASFPSDVAPTKNFEAAKNKASEPERGKEAKRYEDALIAGHTNSKLQGEALRRQERGQPLFDVLMERLLTAYRLACYEELSYRKDDIFSEAIWVSRTFAFPAFRGSVQRVMSANSIDYNLAGRWLQEYELSADVRSAYRTAVIRDINELNKQISCFCEVLWSVITKIVGKVAPEKREQLLAAHLTNIATACQEIHSGRPHSTFQIGGRDKLIQLCGSVASVIGKEFTTEPTNSFDTERLFGNMDQVIAEMIELERSVFQGGEHVTTISFAQCMSTLWGRIARDSVDEGVSDAITPAQVASILQELDLMADATKPDVASATQAATKFQVTEVRRCLDVGLKRTRVLLIRKALVKSWCIGYFSQYELQGGLEFPHEQEFHESEQPNRKATGSLKKGK